MEDAPQQVAAAAADIPPLRSAIVTSGESEGDSSQDEHLKEVPDDSTPAATADELYYDPEGDEADEAYVYQHLRGGSCTETGVDGDDNDTAPSPVKPRSSDAVLQCPCCFQIVCMDCQQHERYKNQFRAMFVQNIAVKWNERLVYDDASQTLVPAVATTESNGQVMNDDEHYYYKTVCANCQTQVAALDMTDEVYHFYGCLASA